MNPTSRKLFDRELGAYRLICDDRAHSVMWFYDRSLRLWTVTLNDENIDQIGDAQYTADRADLPALIERAKEAIK